MDTAPKNQSALTADRPAPPPRQPRPGEPLWTLRKELGRLRAELRDNGEAGAELQLFRDDVFIYGRRYLTRAMAIEDAVGCRRTFEADGWRER